MVHDGDTYFERCYGADFNESIPTARREACWQAWIAHYTKHQPAHRVDYALGRIEALQSGEPAPKLPGSDARGVASEQVSGALDASAAATGHYSSSSLAGTTQGDAGTIPNGCLRFCNGDESRCNARCRGDQTACFTGCERERSICLAGCY